MTKTSPAVPIMSNSYSGLIYFGYLEVKGWKKDELLVTTVICPTTQLPAKKRRVAFSNKEDKVIKSYFKIEERTKPAKTVGRRTSASCTRKAGWTGSTVARGTP